MLWPASTVPSAVVADVVRTATAWGLPSTLATFDRVEVLANVAMVVPAGALGALAWPRLRWQDWAAYGFLVALVVELAQGLLLPQRWASATDVVANTLGVLLGAAVASAARRRAAEG